ncbi:DUF6221 family protein [Streptomyces avermitilis]|uniref:DUF6221 family protein n=1 Tax=Streptomyces avermitilis TaxID=33903 RepID=UPI0033ED1404
MDDLARWLGEQLDEDERIARALNSDPVASMARKFEADALRLRAELDAGKSDRVQYDEGQADALHWASAVLPERMPPLSPFGQARVLREIDAKRRILGRHHDFQGWCAGCGNDLTYRVNECPELRDLAAAYADRPGYREEWRPS